MTNKIRNVTKQLLGAEDVLFGRGIVTQRRGASNVPIHRLDLALPVENEAELAVTNPNIYSKATIGTRTFVAVNGQYQEVSTIQPVIFTVGYTLTSEYPYCIDGDVTAVWEGVFPKTLTLADKNFAAEGWRVVTTNSSVVYTSETPPPNSALRNGLLWYKPSENLTYTYYCDGATCVWYSPETADGFKASLAAPGSLELISGVTAAQVALAADIAIGNFVTPDQFFTEDPADTNADYLSACNAALATGRRVLLKKIYGLSAQLNIPANAVINGLSRNTTGFKRVGASAAGGVIAFNTNNVTLSCFRVDGQNIGSAPSNRLNAVSVNAPAKNFNISQVDVYNCTGYGHVTFGAESNANVTGVYFDCRSENCQVLFEQIGALDVTLYRCIGVGTAGRTTDMFHPYAGSKRVTYVDCHASGSTSGGITATTTSGFPLGPFTFINSSIDIAGSASAVVTSTVSGAAANTDLYFFGGWYRSSGGQSATLQTRGIFKAFGTRFEGLGGFNCPAVPAAEIDLELNGCQLVAAEDNAGATVFSLITNGCNPRVIGGSVEAYNALAGGAQAILGNAIVSRETRTIPLAASQQVSFLAEVAGVVQLTADAATLGFAIVNLPINTTNQNKIVAIATINNRGGSDYLSQPQQLTWRLSGGGSSLTFRYAGNDPTNLYVCYRIGILP